MSNTKGAKPNAKGAKRRAPGKNASVARTSRARMLIDDVNAILLISPNAKRLCDFYRAVLGIPLEEERHDNLPLHYGYSLGDVHFAIHSAEDWPAGARPNARSPVINFSTSNLKAVTRRLSAHGVKATKPLDHGFARIVSFRDPDGNAVSVIEYDSAY